MNKDEVKAQNSLLDSQIEERLLQRIEITKRLKAQQFDHLQQKSHILKKDKREYEEFDDGEDLELVLDRINKYKYEKLRGKFCLIFFQLKLQKYIPKSIGFII